MSQIIRKLHTCRVLLTSKPELLIFMPCTSYRCFSAKPLQNFNQDSVQTDFGIPNLVYSKGLPNQASCPLLHPTPILKNLQKLYLFGKSMVKDREEVNSISSALHFNLYLSQKSEMICTIFRISKIPI